MLTDMELHSLKRNCGSNVDSIHPWDGSSYGKECRYYINLLDWHGLFTAEDKAARIWFTENNPALQVDLKGMPSDHWKKTVARIHREVEAWFKGRNKPRTHTIQDLLRTNH